MNYFFLVICMMIIHFPYYLIMYDLDRNLLDNVDPDSNYFKDNTVNFSKYSMDDFHKSNIDRIKSLNILHNNSRSILRDGRLDEYNILLDYLHNPFQILAFTETWLKPNNVDLVKFDGYNGSHIIRPVDEHFDLKEHGG